MPAATSARRRQLLAALAARITGLGGDRLRVAVDGRTGAGKTSFAHELAREIAACGRPVLRASLDDFKRPWAERHLYDRESAEGYYRNAFDYDRLEAALLRPFSAGSCALCAIDPSTQRDHSAEMFAAAGDAILVVDGVFALRGRLRPWWDYAIWLSVGADLSVERGIARDGGDGRVMVDRYAGSEDIYLREEAPIESADAVIDNSDFASPVLLRGA